MQSSTMIQEPIAPIPVTDSADVVVIGGGIAGVAAAVAAARNGSDVVLLEKSICLGGLATLGNVIVYLPLCDGIGNQRIGGIGEELLRLSVANNDGLPPGLYERRGAIPAPWNRESDQEERKEARFTVEFNPASFILDMEQWILDNGVRLRYDTRFSNVIKQGDRITHVILESKEGRTAIQCGSVVDTSGDADVCSVAGEETVSLASNVPCAWFYYSVDSHVELCRFSNSYDPNGEMPKAPIKGFAGDSAAAVTAQVLESRKSIREKMTGFRQQHENESVYPLILPTVPSLRMGRRLRGAAEPTAEQSEQGIGDIVGLCGDWRKSGPTYQIPYKSLTGVKNSNLITAGRCISVANDLWDVTRAIPVCALTGEIAGTAAAMVGSQQGFSDLPVTELQSQLKQQGMIL